MKSFFINDQNVEVYAHKIGAWIKDNVNKAQMKGVVLGMSGGVDCSVTARLCQLAGVDAYLVLMPYGNDMLRSESQKHAMSLIEKFNFNYYIFDIQPAVDAIHLPADSPLLKANTNLALSFANIRPRVRMTFLYQLEQIESRLVIGTGNLSERSVGYFTKWGDGACDLNPLANITKKEVYTLAHFLEVPACIIQKKPSAGLWDGQTDEDELGMSYAMIDDFILNGTTTIPEIDQKISALQSRSAHKNTPPPFFNS